MRERKRDYTVKRDKKNYRKLPYFRFLFTFLSIAKRIPRL